MDREEPLDAGQQESHPPLAVGERKATARQAPAAPALNGFSGDVEPLGHVFQGEHRLRQRLGRHVQRIADLFDQQPQIVLKGPPGQQLFAQGPRVVSGDAKDDEFERVSPMWIGAVEQVFRRVHLPQPGRVRRELHLPRQLRELVDPISSHFA